MGAVLRRARAYCEASDVVWLICRDVPLRISTARSKALPAPLLKCRESRPRSVRWTQRFILAVCEVAAMQPPPPASPALRYLRMVATTCCSAAVTATNVYLLLTGAERFTSGFSTISKASFVGSTVMTGLQPVVVLLNSLWNFTTIATPMAGLMMAPARFHFWNVLSGLAMAALLVAKHVLYWLSQRKAMANNLLECGSGVLTLAFDLQFCMLCSGAKDKLEAVNERLSTTSKLQPERRALVLETAARQFELTADQVQTLGGMGGLGMPLAANAVRHRVKLVTDSYLVYRAIETLSSQPQHSGTLAALVIQFLSIVIRILATCAVGDSLYREVSKRTEFVLGEVNSAGWTEREKLLVQRLLRNSRRGVAWSSGGFANIDHNFLLSLVGSTVTYLVVLMQYKDPGDDILGLAEGNTTAATTAAPNVSTRVNATT